MQKRSPRLDRLLVSAWLLVCLVAGLSAGLSTRASEPATPAHIGITSRLTAGRSDNSVHPEMRSNRVITLLFRDFDTELDTLSAKDFTLRSDADPAYRKPVAAFRLGYDRQVTGFIDDHTPVSETRLHLLFSQPLGDGLNYYLDARHPELAGVAVAYQPRQLTGSIQVNLVGYAPHARKQAYIGNWLGSAGPMPVDARRFRIIEAGSGHSVMQGTLQLRSANDPWSGNNVYMADFSSLQETGDYYLQVDGLGQSDGFRIDPHIYDNVYRTTARYFYYHRNSVAIQQPWAASDYQRPGGVPARFDAVFHPGVANSPLASDEIPYQHYAVSGGWFDAGDYGQYIPNAAPVWYVINAALDIAPQNFRDSDLNIPESGNGLPDIIDELEWGMQWALSMQDAGDGGVYFRIASASWDTTLPHEIAAPRFIAEKTSHATAAFVAMAAIHSRLLADDKPERAARMLDAAKHAWHFLQTHAQWPSEGERYRNPKGIRAGEYADPSARDNILWAAAELYRSTGEAEYHSAYRDLVDTVSIDPTGVVSFQDQGMAAHWAYIMAPWPDKDKKLLQQSRDIFLSAADWRIRKMQEHPYQAPVHQYRGFLGWGSFAHSSRATLTLFQAFHLTGKQDYLEWAWSTPHPQLGANPQSLCYITGIGARSPRYPLSKLSQMDSNDRPLPGIPVNGPHAYLPALWPSTRAVNAAYLPVASQPQTAKENDGYPVLRRYTDSEYLPPMSEPTIAEVARTAIAYGLLRASMSPTSILPPAN